MLNREGNDVDPVPWFVVVALGFMLTFSVGPGYLMSYGAPLPLAIFVCTGFFGGVVGVSYWRFVYTAIPYGLVEVDPRLRLERLFYAILAGLLVLLAMSLPLVMR